MKPVESRTLQRNQAKAERACAPAPALLPLLSVLALLLYPHPLHAQIEWTPEEQISLDDVYDDWFPRMAAGPDGRVWVVWRGSDGYDPEIMYSVNDGNGWSYPDRVNTDDYAEDTLPDIAVGPDGNPWVVWGKSVGGHSKLYWSRWEGSDWRPEERVFPDSANMPDPMTPYIAVGPDTIPSMVWVSIDPTRGRRLYFTRFEGSGWHPSEVIVDLPGMTLGYPVAVAQDGRIWIVIGHLFSGQSLVFSTSWASGSWAPFDTLPAASGHVTSLVVMPDGRLWTSLYDDGTVSAAQNAQGNWTPPEIVAAPGLALPDWAISCALIDLAASRDGLLWASWMCYGSATVSYQKAVFSAYRTPTGWNSAEQVSSENGFSGGAPRIAVAEPGQAHVVWQGWDGRDFEIVGSHASGAETGPSAQTLLDRPLLRWSPNPARSEAFAWCTGSVGPEGFIDIYSLGGGLVRRVARAPATATRWDCRDDHGRTVPPGTYIWKAVAGGQGHEGTLVVIR